MIYLRSLTYDAKHRGSYDGKLENQGKLRNQPDRTSESDDSFASGNNAARQDSPAERQGFPFDVPVFAHGCHIRFSQPVTILVGDNGTGKSTLLESLAIAVGLPTIGSADTRDDTTLARQRLLAQEFKLTWSRKTRQGFFLRAEDFFNFCKGLKSMRDEFRHQLDVIDETYADRSAFARNQARSPYLRSLNEMSARYGEDLDAMSHGESFLQLFSARLQAPGLYILDEPEAPLSPLRQLTLLHMIRQQAATGSQFIIATHSPMLMAYPGAALYNLNHPAMELTNWDELDHVTIMRDFLNHPELFLRDL